jgi:diaminopimelate decarboxylase
MISAAKKAVKGKILAFLNAREMRDVRALAQSPALWDLGRSPAGLLAWEGIELEQLAARFGTPLHVVSHARLQKDYMEFKRAFESCYPHVEIGYSYKTNPLPGVIAVLHGLGASAEVISEFELWLALKLGVTPKRIIFNGPAKTHAALAVAMEHHIKLINIDNMIELAIVEQIAAARRQPQSVGVRLITSVGWSGQFGLAIADGSAMEAFRRLKDAQFLVPCGVHVHLGNGLRNTAVYTTAAREALAFTRALRAELGIEIRHFDLGGGFGVPTVRAFEGFDERYSLNGLPLRPPQPGEAPALVNYAEEIAQILKAGSDDRPVPELILEPGRAITSRAQLLLVTVIAIKPGDSAGDRVIVDGGKNVAMPPGWEYHEAFLVGNAKGRALRRYSVFGPLCHTGDVMFRNRLLPELAVGDRIAVMDAGAYFIPNQMNFSNPRPAVVMIRGADVSVIRARESFEDIVSLDHWGAVSAT